MSPVEDPALERTAELLAGSRRGVAFTGAGISAESGIPVFRGEGGLWTTMDPYRVASIAQFRKDPGAYWRYSLENRRTGAEPNPAHRALKALEDAGIIQAVITQNTDGLHQKSWERRRHRAARILLKGRVLRLRRRISPGGDRPDQPGADPAALSRVRGHLSKADGGPLRRVTAASGAVPGGGGGRERGPDARRRQLPPGLSRGRHPGEGAGAGCQPVHRQRGGDASRR